jgi:TPR repeat protein
MGFARFMLGLYHWERLSDRNLLEMKRRVENGIITASELAGGSGFVARSSRKDLEKLLESKKEIDAEIARRVSGAIVDDFMTDKTTQTVLSVLLRIECLVSCLARTALAKLTSEPTESFMMEAKQIVTFDESLNQMGAGFSRWPLPDPSSDISIFLHGMNKIVSGLEAFRGSPEGMTDKGKQLVENHFSLLAQIRHAAEFALANPKDRNETLARLERASTALQAQIMAAKPLSLDTQSHPWASDSKSHFQTEVENSSHQGETWYRLGEKHFAVQNYPEAVKWYRKAVEQGHIKAQYSLGQCYGKGQGVPQDYFEAAKWYRKAAERGDACAQQDLAVCYAVGNGVPRDQTEAVKWYRKAADQGHTMAQYTLGVRYFSGDGVPLDHVEGVKWYRKAAEQGLANAQADLGECYHLGNGVPQDICEAAKWDRKAAEQGVAQAQYYLGLCYYEGGGGLRQDRTEAMKWLRRAAEQRYMMAQNFLDFRIRT